MSDRYEFIRKIAQGGFGRVYVARDTRLGREVAIKRLLSPEESASFDQAQATFEREAMTLAALQHPNIVQIYDFDRDDEGTFVVMEMLSGETLKDRLNRGPLVWDTFVMVARQAMDAISAAHSLDILHRDLKPENLFLHQPPGGKRVLKVLDFGLAKLSNVPSRQTMDQSGNVFGSIYYMAPEQFVREPLDGRTDLYALGCVFYQALTAKFAFGGENMQGTMEAHMDHTVRPIRERRPDIPVPVGDWLMRMIARDRADRPADAMAAMREFEAALEGKVWQPPPKAAAGPSSVARPGGAKMVAAPARGRGAGPSSGSGGGPMTARPGDPGTARQGSLTPLPGTMKASSPVGAAAGWRARFNTASRRTRVLVMLGVPALVLLLAGALFVLSGRRQPAAGSVAAALPASAPDVSGTNGGPAAGPLPEPLPLALPAEGAIIWRFRAGAGSRHRNADGKFDPGKLAGGQTVHFWKNLASADAAVGLNPFQGKMERAAIARFAEVKGPGTGHACLYFQPSAGMAARLKPEEMPAAPGTALAAPAVGGATIALVFRANGASKAKLMRPIHLSSADSKHHLSLHCSHVVGQYWLHAEREGRVSQSLVAPEEFAKRKDGAGGSWIVVVGVWDGVNGTVSLRVKTPGGKTVAGPATAIAAGLTPLSNLSVGLANMPVNSQLDPKEGFDGDVLELDVYRQALDVATQDKLLGALWDRYFKQKQG